MVLLKWSFSSSLSHFLSIIAVIGEKEVLETDFKEEDFSSWSPAPTNLFSDHLPRTNQVIILDTLLFYENVICRNSSSLTSLLTHWQRTQSPLTVEVGFWLLIEAFFLRRNLFPDHLFSCLQPIFLMNWFYGLFLFESFSLGRNKTCFLRIIKPSHDLGQQGSLILT